MRVTPSEPSNAAILDAAAAWGGPEAPPILARLGRQGARTRIEAIADREPGRSLDDLRDARAAQAGPDLDRVHPSWLVRALVEESPSVRRAVVATIAEPTRSRLLAGLGLEVAATDADHPADPEAVAIALGLWTERLVGDLPPRPDDPIAIRALSTLEPVGLYRLARLTALAKRSTLPGVDSEPFGPRDRARANRLAHEAGSPPDPRMIELAAADWKGSGPAGRHRLAGLGLASLARVLSGVDPYRARWAIQHIPYPIAKQLRWAMARPQAGIRAVRDREADFLLAAARLLRDEGRPTPIDCEDDRQPGEGEPRS